MILSQDDIGQLAARIERAYRRRHPLWQPVGLTPGVWVSAAARLCEAFEAHPSIPIDPELFVAAQPLTGYRRDPWAELTQRPSRDRYVRSVRGIIGQLRDELRGEVRHAEKRMLRGVTLDRIVADHEPRLSPLSRYILAHRAGRDDLAASLRAAAEAQHRACPLYLSASSNLMPAEAYPRPDQGEDSRAGARFEVAFSLN